MSVIVENHNELNYQNNIEDKFQNKLEELDGLLSRNEYMIMD